jgi:hypothetical protein
MLAELVDEYVTVPPKVVAARLKPPELTARDAMAPNVIVLEAALTEIVIVLVTPEK